MISNDLNNLNVNAEKTGGYFNKSESVKKAKEEEEKVSKDSSINSISTAGKANQTRLDAMKDIEPLGSEKDAMNELNNVTKAIGNGNNTGVQANLSTQGVVNLFTGE